MATSVPYPSQPAPHRGPWRALFWFALILLLGSGLLNVILLIGVAGLVSGAPLGMTRADHGMTMTHVLGDAAATDKVLLVDVTGMIEELSIQPVIRRLRAAEQDDHVKAIVLVLNTPGGTITASDRLHHVIQQMDKPVVSHFQSMAASGGYYISAPADRIVAQPTALTGSIGVLMQMFNVQGLADKVGVKVETIKSADKKDMGSMFRELSPEERREFQDLIDETFDRFVTVVSDGRKLPPEDVRRIADGTVLTGQRALEVKLVDEVGYLEDAIEAAKQLAGLTRAEAVRFKITYSITDLFSLTASARKRSSPLTLDSLLATRAPRLMYLWTAY